MTGHKSKHLQTDSITSWNLRLFSAAWVYLVELFSWIQLSGLTSTGSLVTSPISRDLVHFSFVLKQKTYSYYPRQPATIALNQRNANSNSVHVR